MAPRRPAFRVVPAIAAAVGVAAAGALSPPAARGEARPEVSPLPGQVVVNPENPRWLVRHGGGRVFLCGPGDPEGFFYRGSRLPDGTRSGDQAALIAKLAASGANTLYVMAVRSHGGDGDSTENPFVDGDPALGVSEAILDQWEGWLDTLDAAGIVVLFILYDDSARVWDTGDHVGAPESSFVRQLVDRFERHRNLVWCVAEEYSESFSRARVSALASAIRAADDFGHPIAVHQHHGLSFDFEDDPAIDQFAVQYNAGTALALHSGMVEAWERSAGRYGVVMSEASDWGSGATSRRKAWASAMAGAYVMILGMDIAGTPASDLADCGTLVGFFESLPLERLEPRDELAHGATEYVLAERGDELLELVLWSSNAAAGLGARGIAPGPRELVWFDPVTGASVSRSIVTDGGDVVWAAPEGFVGEVAVHVRPTGTTSVSASTWARVKALYRGEDGGGS